MSLLSYSSSVRVICSGANVSHHKCHFQRVNSTEHCTSGHFFHIFFSFKRKNNISGCLNSLFASRYLEENNNIVLGVLILTRQIEQRMANVRNLLFFSSCQNCSIWPETSFKPLCRLLHFTSAKIVKTEFAKSQGCCWLYQQTRL